MSELDGLGVRVRTTPERLLSALDAPFPRPQEWTDWGPLLVDVGGPLAAAVRTDAATVATYFTALAPTPTVRAFWGGVADEMHRPDPGCRIGGDAEQGWFVARPWYSDYLPWWLHALLAVRGLERVLVGDDSATLVIGNLWWGDAPRSISLAVEVTPGRTRALHVDGARARALLDDADVLIADFAETMEPYPNRSAEILTWRPCAECAP